MNSAAKVIAACVFALSTWFMFLNFHAVKLGQLYRSSQLSPVELKIAARFFGIKTIVNLRGAEHKRWFYGEKAVASELGIDLVNINMSSRTIPDRVSELELLDAYAHAPKPILIHCLSGADRTGEAAAIYDLVILKTSRQEALQMLSPRYLHFKFFRPAKDYFVTIFKGEKWVESNYFPCRGKYRYYGVRNNSACKKIAFVN